MESADKLYKFIQNQSSNGIILKTAMNHKTKVNESLSYNDSFGFGPNKFNVNYNNAGPRGFSCYECFTRQCNNICQNATMCHQSHIVDARGSQSFFRGCIAKEEQVPLICATSFYINDGNYYYVKCCQGNLCNNATFTDFDQRYEGLSGSSPSTSSSSLWLYAGLSLGAIICFLLTVAVSLFMFKRYYKKKKLKFSSKRKFKNMSREESTLPLSADSSLREMLSESVTSGSGSGLPLFVQRTLAKNIVVEGIIGKGRYGEVWKGLWQGEPVAIKIFFSRDESSWARETEIYSTVLLRHENILGFYGSDMTSVASCTQMWLVTQFHPDRSLYDFLQNNSVNHVQLMNMISSFINGLHHLHAEILGTQGKPAIAHRDITSKNVLIKSDATCCIGDLGLAVVRIPESGEINMSSGSRIGTKLYMSPEILNETMNYDNFNSFRKVDMYASAIVMWETMMRCVSFSGEINNYEVPFGDIFPHDPSFEEMRNAVCARNVRPRIPVEWKSDRILSNLLNLVCECWHHNSDVRLTSLRVKKNLTKLSLKENIEIIS